MNPIRRILYRVCCLAALAAAQLAVAQLAVAQSAAAQPAAATQCVAAVQPDSGVQRGRPLGSVLQQVGERFGVRIVCKRFDPDTVQIARAEFRIRPYSLAETLDNLLHPLDLVWSGTEKITVTPYEYYRRTPADGKKLLAWLSAQYADRAAWEARRMRVLDGVREALDLGLFLRGLAADPHVVLGPELLHDGYTTQNYALETLPGLYVCGTIYAPAGPSLPDGGTVSKEQNPEKKRRPLIVSLSGHWEGGRYRADQQLRMATFARMGAVAVDTDIFGWGESERQTGRGVHASSYSMQIQLLWSKAVTDWIVASRGDIDTTRIAATGGSGGATHALLLAVADGRFAALAPVVHLVSHFDGGCPCESGRPVTLAGDGSCMPEILAAAMAPRPVLVVSDGGDWTATYPELEYPFLRRIWAFYGAESQVRNVHLPDERHDYGANKRRAVYAFFARTLGLDASQVDEDRVRVLPEAALRTFRGELPPHAVRSRCELERVIEKLK